MLTVTEKRPSTIRRIVRAFRRCRELLHELLHAPELLKHLYDQAIAEIVAGTKGELSAELEFSLHDQAERIAEIVAGIKGEPSAELGFSLHDQVERIAEIVAGIKGEPSAELGFSLHDQVERIAELQSDQAERIVELRSHLAELSQTLSETKNLVTHVNTSVHTRLNTLQNQELPSISNQIHEMIAAQLELFNQIGGIRRRPAAQPKERYRPAKGDQWDASIERAQHEFSTVYPLWQERLGTMLQAFHQTKVGNAAWAGDVESRVFRGFVERYAQGRILDVGCGIFGRPYYLSSYPAELISGLDPLEPIEPPDFEFVRGISEYLPWPDASFSTIISATSLDHCLSLDRSLAEIRRTLRPAGCFLLWIGSNPGAPKYEPDSPEFTPSDRYHLFHFDVGWFQPMLLEAFEIVDRIELQRRDYSSIMYCLERRSDPIARPQR